MIKFLARQHQVHLACLLESKADLRHVEALRAQVASVSYQILKPMAQKLHMANALLTSQPLTVANFWSEPLHRQIKSLARRHAFDAVVVYSSTMAEYVQDLKIPMRIMDFCDLDSVKFAQYAQRQGWPASRLFRLESRRLAAYEQKVAREFDFTILIGPEEKRLFNSNGFSERVKLMSNGIDLAQYQNIPEATADNQAKGRPYVVFVGAMDYWPNIDAAHWFASQMFPVLKQQIADLEFWVIGRHPVRKIRQLHNPERGIRITGYLDDLRPILKNARVFVAPMRIARGMQTKILEAMACEIPVVTTPDAARGIGAAHGQELLVAENADDFIRQTLLLYHDRRLAKKLVKSAYRFLLQKFNWEQNLQLLNQLLLAQPALAK